MGINREARSMMLFGHEIEEAYDGITCESLAELLEKIHWCKSVGLMDFKSKLRLQPYAVVIAIKEAGCYVDR